MKNRIALNIATNNFNYAVQTMNDAIARVHFESFKLGVTMLLKAMAKGETTPLFSLEEWEFAAYGNAGMGWLFKITKYNRMDAKSMHAVNDWCEGKNLKFEITEVDRKGIFYVKTVWEKKVDRVEAVAFVKTLDDAIDLKLSLHEALELTSFL